MNGAEALLESLRREGVDVIFGISGGQALPIYDALAKEGAGGIRNILTRHEQGAAHMAEGYAKSTGKVGVCLATSGPGATNLVTGIADAILDSVPMVAITGQVPTTFIGTDAFQEADIMGITMPIVKHSFQVRSPDEVADIVKKAFFLARSGRPGPVLIDMPRDMSIAPVKSYRFPEEVSIRGYVPRVSPDPAGVEAAAALIAAAEKPVIYAGGGVIIAGAQAELLSLAEKINAPVTTTLMGRGAIPDRHPLALHMLGMHGTAYANWAVGESDLLIAVGARFDDRVTGDLKKFAPHAKVIHLEVDPAEVNKNRAAQAALMGDAKETLALLAQAAPKKDNSPWLEKISRWKRDQPLRYHKNGQIKPQQVVEEISRITGGDIILASDVGQHQMWAAQFFQFNHPRQWLTSGGLGTMGFGFPAAIGAKVANPDKEVWVITGDGSFQMNLQELATSAVYGIPIKIALFNNKSLGMVKQWQELFYDKRYQGIHLENVPDYVKLAEAYGLAGIKITDPAQVVPALEKARQINDRTVLLDFHVDPNEHVYPMIPGGQSVAEMRLQPDERRDG
ncbi:MAG: biosynthetic-type acetolactate synthase large subunit [Deltaproteobacteria bacterium]|nr:biosynthetic-type acetolactate synthase large subunit [Deltaproteobacteria bacterium]